MTNRIALSVLTLGFLAGSVFAADVPQIVWGELTALEEGAPAKKTWATTQTHDGRTMSVLFDDLQISSKDNELSVTASFQGAFADLIQSERLAVQHLKVDIRGHVTKDSSGTASIAINVGGQRLSKKWDGPGAVSSDFTFDIAGKYESGRLPVPFTVEVQLDAAQNAAEDNTLLALDSFDISVQ